MNRPMPAVIAIFAWFIAGAALGGHVISRVAEAHDVAPAPCVCPPSPVCASVAAVQATAAAKAAIAAVPPPVAE